MRKILLSFLFIFLGACLAAHEFWIQPDRYLYEPGQNIFLRFWIGENFEGQNWAGSRKGVGKISFRQNDIQDDLTGSLGEKPGDSLEIGLGDEGTAMICMETLPEYLLPDSGRSLFTQGGGTSDSAMRDRKEQTVIDSPGMEWQAHCVKTIFQVGKLLNGVCLQRSGLLLDIVPASNPYDPKNPSELGFTVYFKGSPLPEQQVTIWHRAEGATEKSVGQTDEHGRLSLPVVKTGKWMLSTVVTEPVASAGAEQKRYWGSCNWGYIR